jgi:CheY-like chemotaxis protein
LVVEDDPGVRELLCLLLEDDGYTVYAAENGKVAACMLSRQPPPSLVLTDLRMPVMNGWELIDRLRHTDELAEVPVVVISAEPDGLAPSGVRLLRKPFSALAVLEAVERCSTTP